MSAPDQNTPAQAAGPAQAAAQAPSAAANDPSDPKNQLAIKIADLVLQASAPQFEVINQSLAMILRHLAQLHAATVVNGAGAKKAVPPRTPRAGEATAGNTEELDTQKVRNAMLYMRWKYMTDAEYRKRVATPNPDTGISAVALQGLLDNDSTTSTKAKDSQLRYSAEAKIIWKKAITNGEKETMKAEFEAWRNQKHAAKMAPPLGAEPGRVADIEPAAAAPITAQALEELLGDPSF